MNTTQKDHVLDATRVTDGVKVVLKRVHSDGDEVQIALHLSSVEMSSDPRNRTVPILDVITLPDDKYILLVMPYLRVFNTPPFHCRGEVVEALRQFLQACVLEYSLQNYLFIAGSVGSRVHAWTQYIAWVWTA
jgi:hypothetical protein